MTDYKQRLDELVKLRDDELHSYGGIQARQVAGEAITLAQELHAELVSLKNKHADEVASLLNQVERLKACLASVPPNEAAGMHQLRTAADKMKEALEAHRRFHGKVGCPDDCYVCEADENSYPYEQARGGE